MRGPPPIPTPTKNEPPVQSTVVVNCASSTSVKSLRVTEIRRVPHAPWRAHPCVPLREHVALERESCAARGGMRGAPRVPRVRTGARGYRERFGRRLLSTVIIARRRNRHFAHREREVTVTVEVAEPKDALVPSPAQKRESQGAFGDGAVRLIAWRPISCPSSVPSATIVTSAVAGRNPPAERRHPRCPMVRSTDHSRRRRWYRRAREDRPPTSCAPRSRRRRWVRTSARPQLRHSPLPTLPACSPRT